MNKTSEIKKLLKLPLELSGNIEKDFEVIFKELNLNYSHFETDDAGVAISGKFEFKLKKLNGNKINPSLILLEISIIDWAESPFLHYLTKHKRAILIVENKISLVSIIEEYESLQEILKSGPRNKAE